MAKGNGGKVGRRKKIKQEESREEEMKIKGREWRAHTRTHLTTHETYTHATHTLTHTHMHTHSHISGHTHTLSHTHTNTLTHLHRLMSCLIEFKVFVCLPSLMCLSSLPLRMASYSWHCRAVSRQHTN